MGIASGTGISEITSPLPLVIAATREQLVEVC
jgi:hypothetical protein